MSIVDSSPQSVTSQISCIPIIPASGDFNLENVTPISDSQAAFATQTFQLYGSNLKRKPLKDVQQQGLDKSWNGQRQSNRGSGKADLTGRDEYLFQLVLEDKSKAVKDYTHQVDLNKETEDEGDDEYLSIKEQVPEDSAPSSDAGKCPKSQNLEREAEVSDKSIRKVADNSRNAIEPQDSSELSRQIDDQKKEMPLGMLKNFRRWRAEAISGRYLPNYIRKIPRDQEEILESGDSWQPPLVGIPLRPGSLPIDLLDTLSAAADRKADFLAIQQAESKESCTNDSVNYDGQIFTKQPQADDDCASSESSQGLAESQWPSSPERDARIPNLPPDSSPLEADATGGISGVQSNEIYTKLALDDHSKTYDHNSITSLGPEQQLLSQKSNSTSHLKIVQGIGQDCQELDAIDHDSSFHDEVKSDPLTSPSSFGRQKNATQGRTVQSDEDVHVYSSLLGFTSQPMKRSLDSMASPTPSFIPATLSEGSLQADTKATRNQSALSIDASQNHLCEGNGVKNCRSDRSSQLRTEADQYTLANDISSDFLADPIIDSHIARSSYEASLSSSKGLQPSLAIDQIPSSKRKGIKRSFESMTRIQHKSPAAADSVANEDSLTSFSPKKKLLVQDRSMARPDSDSTYMFSEISESENGKLSRLVTASASDSYRASPSKDHRIAVAHLDDQLDEEYSFLRRSSTGRNYQHPSSAEKYSLDGSRASEQELPATTTASGTSRRSSFRVDDTYSKFKTSYRDYKGSKNHFGNACQLLRRLQGSDNPPHPFLYDDMIYHHYHGYLPYLFNVIDSGADAISFNSFYSLFVEKPSHLDGVVSKASLSDIAGTGCGDNIPTDTLGECHQSQEIITNVQPCRSVHQLLEDQRDGNPADEEDENFKSPMMQESNSRSLRGRSRESHYPPKLSVQLWCKRTAGAESPELGSTTLAKSHNNVTPLVLPKPILKSTKSRKRSSISSFIINPQRQHKTRPWWKDDRTPMKIFAKNLADLSSTQEDCKAVNSQNESGSRVDIFSWRR